MSLHARKPIGSLRVSPLALGGNVFGWTADEAATFAILDKYTEAGGNFIDTADVYSAWVDGHTGGESEALIGKWLSARRNRSQVVIASKVGAHPRFAGLAAATIERAAEASLERLGTDHLDLYYTHVDDDSVEVAEIMTTLDALVKAGKVREIGASNISPARLHQALAFSAREGLARHAAVQPHYNLVARDRYEDGLAPVVARHGLAAVPYFALAKGFLTGKYRPGRHVESARGRQAARYLETARGRRVLAALNTIAAARHVEHSAVAVAWLAAQPTVTAPLASARTTGQLAALLQAGELALTAAEIDSLTNASAHHPGEPA